MKISTEKTIFLEALDADSAEDREAYLAEACGGDAKLRAGVDALLRAHGMPENPLDQPVARASLADTAYQPQTLAQTGASSSNPIGVTIGNYKLMEQIGEGGFGLVFVAQQDKPVRRKVALKIVKPGMGSKDVIARFEAERQALAMMDHPNIAQVFDAGVYDESGVYEKGGEGDCPPTLVSQRPYFVMELVKGIPITDFCDSNQLSTKERLELFESVCDAVQHAHQKGVIHRDIKPSNVLVTLHDAKPVVKVIDFGIAKAIGSNLTDKTIYTQFHAMMGTPLYMSPEQAALSGLDIDTRSDIYSLGVLLYELLTGMTPFDRKRLDRATYDELRRIIRDETPPKPSSAVTTMGERLSTISTARQIEPNRLSSLLRGDLDWIVLKAMEKDRNRRYESVASLAKDIRRHLSHEAIEARPPSRAYLVSKFAQRHRATLVTVGLVFGALILGTAVSLWQMSVAIGERDDKDAAMRAAMQAKIEADAAKEEVEQFTDRLQEANLLMADAQANLNSKNYELAHQQFTDAVKRQPNYFLTRLQRGRFYRGMNLWSRAAEDLAAAIRLGAPARTLQQDELPQLFLLSGHQESYHDVIARMLGESVNLAEITWNDLRAALLAPDARISQADLLAAAIEKSNGQPWSQEAWFDAPGPPGRRDFGPERNGPGAPRGRAGFRQPPPEPPDPMGMPGGPFRAMQDRRMPRGVTLYILGWAYLRTGDHQSAIDVLSETARARGWQGGELTLPLMAMAHDAEGDNKSAFELWQQSNQVVQDFLRQLSSDEEPSGPSLRTAPWIDQAEMLILHREATKQIKSDTKSLDASLAEVEARALRKIGL